MPKVFAIRVVTGPRFLADGDLQSRGFNPINNLFQIITAWSMKQSNCLIGSNRSYEAKQPLRRLHVSSELLQSNSEISFRGLAPKCLIEKWEILGPIRKLQLNLKSGSTRGFCWSHLHLQPARGWRDQLLL